MIALIADSIDHPAFEDFRDRAADPYACHPTQDDCPECLDREQ